MNNSCVLGIDTSNYKTSVAIIDKQGDIQCDLRRLLKVKQGEKGLRQSYALFQHMENVPELLEEALKKVEPGCLVAIACSDRPRPVEGSYMPVFKSGINFGRTLAASLNLPLFRFSHQEGHLEAVRRYANGKFDTDFLFYHLSGGTSELLAVSDGKIDCIGGSRDLAFGQVIDRVGVALGLDFPAGEALDRMALQHSRNIGNYLKPIPVKGLFLNLSGIETQTQRVLSAGLTAEETESLITELFTKIGESLCRLTQAAAECTNKNKVLFAGGVSSSLFISDYITNWFKNSDISVDFGDQTLSQDNAVGIALLGGAALWQ